MSGARLSLPWLFEELRGAAQKPPDKPAQQLSPSRDTHPLIDRVEVVPDCQLTYVEPTRDLGARLAEQGPAEHLQLPLADPERGERPADRIGYVCLLGDGRERRGHQPERLPDAIGLPECAIDKERIRRPDAQMDNHRAIIERCEEEQRASERLPKERGNRLDLLNPEHEQAEREGSTERIEEDRIAHPADREALLLQHPARTLSNEGISLQHERNPLPGLLFFGLSSLVHMNYPKLYQLTYQVHVRVVEIRTRKAGLGWGERDAA